MNQFSQFYKLAIKESNLVLNSNSNSELLNITSLDFVENIVTQALNTKIDNVVIKGIKDSAAVKGAKLDFLKSKEKDFSSRLSSLDFSVRVTNIQLLNKDLKDLCLNLYRSLGTAVTINMYITPGKGRNCFLSHKDPQDTLIYQVAGRKKWIFPVSDSGEIIRDFNIKDQSQIHAEKSETKIIEIKKNDILFIPYCMIHKAEAFEDEISVHLTFAASRFAKASFISFIQTELNSLLNIDKSFYKPLDTHEMDEAIQEIKSYFLKQSENELKNKMLDIEETHHMKIMKFGRAYEAITEEDG